MGRFGFGLLFVIAVSALGHAAVPTYFESAPHGSTWIARTGGGTLAVTGHSLSFADGGVALTLRFAGAKREARWRGAGKLPGHSLYLLGGEKKRIAEHYARIEAARLYPGIDATVRLNKGLPEYEFSIQAGGEPSTIRMVFPRESHIEIDAAGDLVVRLGGATVRHRKPFAYQEGDGGRRPIPARFARRGSFEVGFEVAAFDRSRTLVIDPSLRFANTIGGSGSEAPHAIASDSAGNIYVAGGTLSADFPRTTSLPSGVTQSRSDAFITKIDPSGQQVLYSVYFGGTDVEDVSALAVDSQGSVYALGMTHSRDFPTTPGAYNTVNTTQSIYVVKLDSQGTRFVYATFLGATSPSGREDLAVDREGNAFICGVTNDPNPPVTAGAWRTSRGTATNAYFLAKLNAAGSSLVYGTLLPVVPTAVALAPDGSTWVTGSGSRQDFPMTTGMDFSQGSGAVALRINPAGSDATFGTMLGGSGGSSASDIALDAAGNVYLTGIANPGSSSNPGTPFPTTEGAALRTLRLTATGFVAKIDPAARRLAFSTFVDAQNRPQYSAEGTHVFPASDGTVWVAAYGALIAGLEGFGFDPVAITGAGLVRFNSAGSAVISSTVIPAQVPFPAAFDDRFFYLASYAYPSAAAVTAGARPLSPSGALADVVVSAIDLRSSDLPSVSINAGYLVFEITPDGGTQALSKTISITSSGAPVRFRVIPPRIDFGNNAYLPLRVSPEEGVTPAEVTVIADPSQQPSGERMALLITAIGAVEPVKALPVHFSRRTPTLNATATPLRAPQPGAVATGFLTITASYRGVWGVVPTQYPFRILRQSPLPALTIGAGSGVAPASIPLTANSAGLPPGIYTERLRVEQFPAIINPTVFFVVGPSFRTDVAPLQFTFFDSNAQTQRVRLDSTGLPLSFTATPSAPHVSVSPTSGTTPAELEITVNPVGLANGQRRDSVGIYAPEAASPFTITINSQVGPSPDTAPSLQIMQSGTGGPAEPISPGALVWVATRTSLTGEVRAPRVPWPTSLGGYRIAVNGTPIPLSRVGPSLIYGQLPYGVPAGTARIELQNDAGAVLATAQARISDVPIPLSLAPRVRRQDGTDITPETPVQVGDLVQLSLTGQGPLQPAVPAGELPPAGVSARPVARISAKVGGKDAEIVSAAMSASEVGTMNVTLRIPDLFPDDHWVWVQIGSASVYGIPVRIAREATNGPRLNAGGVVNAASFASGAVAPGSLVSAFGLNFVSATSVADAVPLPSALGGTSFALEGFPVPLLMVSPTQVNFQVPWETGGRSSVTMTERIGSGTAVFGDPVLLREAAPGIFVMGQNRQGAVVVANAGVLAAPAGAFPESRPARRGEYITIYATGLGPVTNTPASGAPAAALPLSETLSIPSVTIGGVTAPVSFSGLAPGFVGLNQINVQIPAAAPVGDNVPLVLTIGGTMSNTVTVAVQP